MHFNQHQGPKRSIFDLYIVVDPLVDADLGANKDSCLDPLVFLAPSVLEPDSNDPGVQSCHLN